MRGIGPAVAASTESDKGWDILISETMNAPVTHLTDLAVDVVNRYDDEQLWNEFFSAWMASGKPVKPSHSGAQMAAELLAAEVLRLHEVARQANTKIAALEKRVAWYVDRDSAKAGNA